MVAMPKKNIEKPKNGNFQNKKTFHDFTFRSIEGKEIPLSNYKGKKVLIINTASECGFTPQFSELEELHLKYNDKVTLLGFPANNFGGQEPGSNHEIAAFCQRNFGVTFQLFEKSEVIGQQQNPVYSWLTHADQNGWNNTPPNWNFCKYLVGENGELLKFYSSSVSPLSEEVTKEL